MGRRFGGSHCTPSPPRLLADAFSFCWRRSGADGSAGLPTNASSAPERVPTTYAGKRGRQGLTGGFRTRWPLCRCFLNEVRNWGCGFGGTPARQPATPRCPGAGCRRHTRNGRVRRAGRAGGPHARRDPSGGAPRCRPGAIPVDRTPHRRDEAAVRAQGASIRYPTSPFTRSPGVPWFMARAYSWAGESAGPRRAPRAGRRRTRSPHRSRRPAPPSGPRSG